jgi:hypothetical protein
MKYFNFLLLIFLLSNAVLGFSQNKTIKVSDVAQLKLALANAKPGQEIDIKDGVYIGNFIIPVSGTTEHPIILKGSRKVILDGGTNQTGYVLYLKADYWIIKGITIRNGLKGLVTEEANHNIIDGILVTQIGEEAVHFRKFSTHNSIQNSEISYTGLKTPDYGEGVYIGSAISNWPKYSNSEPDKCDANQVINNKIGPFVAAECIDIKEGTTGGLIKGNTFDSQGITGANYADSWIDVKGNAYIISDNIGNNSQPSVLQDGFQINCAATGWGNDNEFMNNICHVNADGFGFSIRLKSAKGEPTGNKVYGNNKVINAKKGLTNIQISK